MEEELRVILKSFDGEATADELAMLEKWLQRSEDNKSIYLQMKNIWEVSDRSLPITEIDVEGALDHVLQAVSYRKKKERQMGWRTLRRIAAVIFLPLVITSYYLGKNASHLKAGLEGHETYREVFTAYGTMTHLSLSDGSSIWLNSGSRLLYPDKFGEIRKVMLEGEAYFEVESDVKSPFVVETDNLSIEATGTAFNVLASPSEPEVEVTLVRGSVAVKNKENNGNMARVATLHPSQHLTYDTLTRDYQLEDQDPYRYISWKDGLLVFRNVPMVEVVKKIGHQYNVDIELQDEELKSYRYRATFENESFEEIMKLLKLSSPIDYYEQERSVLPDGSFTKRKVIIFAKR